MMTLVTKAKVSSQTPLDLFRNQPSAFVFLERNWTNLEVRNK